MTQNDEIVPHVFILVADVKTRELVEEPSGARHPRRHRLTEA